MDLTTIAAIKRIAQRETSKRGLAFQILLNETPGAELLSVLIQSDVSPQDELAAARAIQKAAHKRGDVYMADVRNTPKGWRVDCELTPVFKRASTLRDDLVKLAYDNPGRIRNALLPVLKRTAPRP